MFFNFQLARRGFALMLISRSQDKLDDVANLLGKCVWMCVCVCLHNIMETCSGLRAHRVGWWGCDYGQSVTYHLSAVGSSVFKSAFRFLIDKVVYLLVFLKRSTLYSFWTCHFVSGFTIKFGIPVFHALVHPAKLSLHLVRMLLSWKHAANKAGCVLLPHCWYGEKQITFLALLKKKMCGSTCFSCDI